MHRRLEALNPLAVLARGYAVCWTADRTRVLRDASAATGGRLLCNTSAPFPAPWGA